jgi:hypothetical protein
MELRRIVGRKGNGDSALGVLGVGLTKLALGQAENRAMAAQLNGGAQACYAGADNYKIEG